MNATLFHSQSHLVTRENLLTIPPPPATATCNPDASWDDLRFENARLELCRILEALCDRQAFSPSLSFAAIEVFHRNHLVLGDWDQHRLHVLAAFHGAVTS